MPDIDDVDADEPLDPSQRILPRIDAGMKVRGHGLSDFGYSLPGLGVAGAGGVAFAYGFIDPAGAIGALSAGGALSGSGFALSSGAGETTTPMDRLRTPIRSSLQDRQMPMDRDRLLDDPPHGVERVSSEGFVEMDDGRLVAFIRLHGRNSDFETEEERQKAASSLSGRALDALGEYGFRYYSTTVEFDDGLAERFRSVASPSTRGYRGGEWATARAVLEDVANWHENSESDRWDAREWCHYAIVSVREDEVTSLRGDEGRLAPFFESVPGFSSSLNKTDEDRMRARQQRKLRKRVAALGSRVLAPTPGVEVEQAGGGEVAAVLARYWRGTSGAFDSGSPADPEDEKTLERALSADEYDSSDDYVQVGRQYARTYWVSGWPEHPPAELFREIATMRGVDVDVTTRLDATDDDNVKSKLKHKTSEIRADISEKEEEQDLHALAQNEGMVEYLQSYLLLEAGETQTWSVNTYITVRAGTRDALDSAEEALNDNLVEETTLNVERARALNDRRDRVQEVAESKPSDLMLLSPASRSKDLFESGSPVGKDVYRRSSSHQRARIALNGAVGALFPAISTVYQHDDGIGWGRSRQNGSEVIANPFNVGGPAHGLFIGDSGSGKTYSVALRAIRWWLADPDRTLVLAGPFGDLSGLVDAFNGDRLVIGGSQTINPLAVSPDTEHERDQGTDAVKQKVTEIASFLSGILRENGVDPGDFTTTMKNAAYRTYAEAGIYPHDPESQRRQSPTMEDYRAELAEMAENPKEEADSESPKEHDTIEERAALLLRELSGFQEGRDYEHYVGRSEFSITEGGLSYIDLQQMESLGAVGKSAALQSVLARVYETVKSSDDETLFLLDEAHYLLHNEETLEWLQRATRHWRHHDAGLWMASQRPDEFIGGTDAEDASYETIRSQCSIKQITDLDGVDEEVAEKFDLNKNHVRFIDEKAVRGDDGAGYADALLSFKDMEGWLRVQVRASPLEDHLLTHKPGKSPPIDEHLAEFGIDYNPTTTETNT